MPTRWRILCKQAQYLLYPWATPGLYILHQAPDSLMGIYEMIGSESLETLRDTLRSVHILLPEQENFIQAMLVTALPKGYVPTFLGGEVTEDLCMIFRRVGDGQLLVLPPSTANLEAC